MRLAIEEATSPEKRQPSHHAFDLFPIRLVRMVEKIESTVRSLQCLWVMNFMDRDSHLIHHPCKTDGVLRTAEAMSC